RSDWNQAALPRTAGPREGCSSATSAPPAAPNECTLIHGERLSWCRDRLANELVVRQDFVVRKQNVPQLFLGEELRLIRIVPRARITRLARRQNGARRGAAAPHVGDHHEA